VPGGPPRRPATPDPLGHAQHTSGILERARKIVADSISTRQRTEVEVLRLSALLADERHDQPASPQYESPLRIWLAPRGDPSRLAREHTQLTDADCCDETLKGLPIIGIHQRD
jgi:hypothetical protein